MNADLKKFNVELSDGRIVQVKCFNRVCRRPLFRLQGRLVHEDGLVGCGHQGYEANPDVPGWEHCTPEAEYQ